MLLDREGGHWMAKVRLPTETRYRTPCINIHQKHPKTKHRNFTIFIEKKWLQIVQSQWERVWCSGETDWKNVIAQWKGEQKKRAKFCQIKCSKLSRNKHLSATENLSEDNSRTTKRTSGWTREEIRFQSDSIPTVDRQDYYLLFDLHLFSGRTKYIKFTTRRTQPSPLSKHGGFSVFSVHQATK